MIAPPTPPPAIEVRNLHFHYPTSEGSLHDISFTIQQGSCAAIIGPNGAGKSTLLQHLNGILPEEAGQSGGEVLIFGKPVSTANLPEIRRLVGLVFQNPDDQIFCPTVFDDVAFGPRQFTKDETAIAVKVKECLRSVGLAGFEERLPHQLSGGEKRRVCLAGVLACDAKILALDEPTSDLDPRGRREFMALLGQLSITRLIATHDLEMVLQLCGQVIVLDRGSVVAQGQAVTILSDEPLMLRHGLEMPLSLRKRD
jgi:cobalt/nickel transport system ATP-binding protein